MRKKNHSKSRRKKKTVFSGSYTYAYVLLAAILLLSAFVLTGLEGEGRERTAYTGKDIYGTLYADIEDEDEIEQIKKRKKEQEKNKKKNPAVDQTTEGQEKVQTKGQEATSQPGGQEATRQTESQQATSQTESQQASSQADNPDPDQPVEQPDSYEIHLLLDSGQVLDGNGLLKKEICDLFNVKKDYKSFALAYYETADRLFNQEGWINRIRMREDKPKKDYKITFKKRYPVAGEDVNAAMSQARSEGFDKADQDWESQVEWNYSSMVLSFSAEASGATEGLQTMDQLALEDALAMLRENMPEKEQNWKSPLWGLNTLQTAGEAGPVRFKRYTGRFQDAELDIEVWTLTDPDGISSHYITELSFKEKDYNKAAGIRKALIEDLKVQGLLLEQDGLKTQHILDLYFPLN